MAATEFKDLPEVRAKLKPTVIFVRHGSTSYDGEGAKNMVQGWLPGGLNDQGKREARKIARTLQDFPIRKVYTSDLDRAQDTADILHDYGLPKANALKMLRCWKMGVLEGLSKTAAIRKTIDMLQNDKRNYALPKMETYNQFKNRFLPAMKSMLEEAKEKPEDGFIIAVIHSDALRMIHAWVKAGCSGDALDKDLLSEALHMVHVNPGEAAVLTPKRDGYQISYLKGKP